MPISLPNALRRLAALMLLASAPLAHAQDEVPFITSPDNVTLQMLEIAHVGPADHVIDLGSGDGRIVILAARRFGASGLGVELVPDLVRQSNQSAQQAGVAARTRFLVQDLFKTDLSAATVITMYLLPEVNLQLRPAILALQPGTRIVSHDWDMGDWAPDRTVVVPVPDKKVGLEKSSKIHLWIVPARVDGLWCSTGALRGASLQIAQRYQAFDATLRLREASQAVKGRILGTSLQAADTGAGPLALVHEGGQLRVVAATGALANAQGASFRKAAGSSCG
jgi:SAM-dependent methyltransferase